MNRLHARLKVKDLDRSVEFYSALFGQRPSKIEADYARWMLEDPRANIALSTRGAQAGIDHVGLQTDDRDGLDAIAARLKDAGVGMLEEPGAACCYARSDKYWTQSPDGAKWELYHTFADSTPSGASPAREAIEQSAGPCCGTL